MASSQVMPRKIKNHIKKVELAIQSAIQEKAAKKKELVVLEASIVEKRKTIRDLNKEIRTEQTKAEEIRALIPNIEALVFERSGVIGELEEIYLEDS